MELYQPHLKPDDGQGKRHAIPLHWMRANALSLSLLALFLLFLGGMSVVGLQNYNDDQREHGEQPIT